VPKDTLKKSLKLIERYKQIKSQKKEINKLKKIENEIESRMNVTSNMEQQVYDELNTVKRVRKHILNNSIDLNEIENVLKSEGIKKNNEKKNAFKHYKLNKNYSSGAPSERKEVSLTLIKDESI